MKLANEDKTCLFCFLGKETETNYYYLFLQKLQFYNLDLSQNNYYKKINSTTFTNELKVNKTGTITCVEISKYNLIQCFYINIYNYLTLGLFSK